jgi:hypothetical protein
VASNVTALGSKSQRTGVRVTVGSLIRENSDVYL